MTTAVIFGVLHVRQGLRLAPKFEPRSACHGGPSSRARLVSILHQNRSLFVAMDVEIVFEGFDNFRTAGQSYTCCDRGIDAYEECHDITFELPGAALAFPAFR